MAKNKTGLYIGLGAVALGVVYLMTRRTASTATPSQAATAAAASSGSGLISQVSSLASTISKLFGGSSSSSPAAGTAAAWIAPTIAPTDGVDSSTLQSVSPAGQINYINPSAPAIPITAAPAPATADIPDTTFDDPFNSEA